MSLLGQLHLQRKPNAPHKLTPVLSNEQAELLRGAVKVIDEPVPLVKPKSRGRVIKQTKTSEFNPDSTFTGGRIVKVMPKKLQKIKQAQEMVEDDSAQPTVEDLEE